MVAIVLGIAAVIAAIPGGYLLRLLTLDKYTENRTVSSLKLTDLYIRTLADLHSKIASEMESTSLTAVEILSGENYIPEIRKLNEIINERDTITKLYKEFQSTNLTARYLLLLLVALILLALVTEAVTAPTSLVVIWIVVIVILVLILSAHFLKLYKTEREFDKLTLRIIYNDEINEE